MSQRQRQEVLAEFIDCRCISQCDCTVDATDFMADEIVALRAERAALRKDAMGVVNVLGFFASCIKSGEPWTPQCEDMLRAAFAHRDAAMAVQRTN